jgi:hypothetical protein
MPGETMSDAFKVHELRFGEKINTDFRREMRPVEIYIKPDGSLTDEPSFAMVMEDVDGGRYIGQLSLAMFQPAIDALQRAHRKAIIRKNPDFKNCDLPGCEDCGNPS